MQLYKNPAKETWNELFKRPVEKMDDLENAVLQIINTVKVNGDNALFDFALKFDKVKLTNLIVSEEEFIEAENSTPESLKQAIKTAKQNIEKFHNAQLPAYIETETMPGVVCTRKAVPVQTAGLYIPAGTAPLFSTVLMLAIPAKVANCKEVYICTPPSKSGKINNVILYTAKLCGVKTVYKTGGAQAIAAMALGTETIPAANKIFGPGNAYVTMAKMIVNGKFGVAIDMPAGPSEVMVIADDTANPEFVAADLLSQAEHGVDSQVILLTNSADIIPKVKNELDNQLSILPRKAIAEKCLENSKIIYCNDLKTIIEMINFYAPEHLIIQTQNPEQIAENVVNAGSVFLGNFTPESVGDYASGTNHTLPTSGYAKAISGLSVESYMKYITFQKLTGEGIKNLGKIVEIMADAEQLAGHKNAVSVRLKSLN